MATFLLSAFADEASEMLDGQIAALKRNDLHCIEPRNINGGPTLRKTDEELFAIRKQLDDAGITVPSFGSPIGKWKITDDFEPQLADFRRALRVCEILGTKRMRMFSYYLDRTQMKEYREEILRRLSVMLEEGERAGIKLCHENEGEIYGQNPEDVADILTSLPGLHAVYDPANFVFCRQDPIKGLDVSIGSMEYMHIKDAAQDGGEIMMVPAGTGDGRIKEVLQRVDKTFDREIVLTLEPHLYVSDSYKKFDGRGMKHRFHFETADEAFDYGVNSLKKVLAEIGHPIVGGKG